MSESAARNRVGFMVSMTIIGIAIVFLIIAGFFALTPVEVIRPNVQPYKIVTKTVKAGDNVVYTVDSCKYKDILGQATRTFVDAEGVRYPITTLPSNVPTGCGQKPVGVPTQINYHPGVWHLDLDIQYQVNPLRTENYHFSTEEFTITQ